MRKFIVLLLCLSMLLSLLSCAKDGIIVHDTITESDVQTSTDAYDPTTDTTADNTPVTNASQKADYSRVLQLYRNIIGILPGFVDSKDAMDFWCAELGIVDAEEKALFGKLFSSVFDFKKDFPYKYSCGYALKDLNGDGVDELVLLNNEYHVIAVFSYADGKPVLLGNYKSRDRCWIDGEGLLHENGSNGADLSTNAIYKIADGGRELELIVEFGTNGHEWVGDVAYTKYYKLVDGERVDISEEEWSELHTRYGKYLGYYAGAEATREHSGLCFTSLYTEAEIAMEMYRAVLENKIEVYDVCGTETSNVGYLKSYRTPYEGVPLCDLKKLNYVYMDVDGNGIRELVIECGDILILRYYEGAVYLYPFTCRQMYNLHTDGSYFWNDTSENFEYGESKLAFDGVRVKSREIWRIVNDGEPNVEYYIGGEQFTKEAVLKYIEENVKTDVTFVPLEVSWLSKISREEAITIAREYWEHYQIEENKYFVTDVESSRAPSSVHVIVIKCLVMDHHYSTFDEIWIDKNTGDVIIPYDLEGKG